MSFFFMDQFCVMFPEICIIMSLYRFTKIFTRWKSVKKKMLLLLLPWYITFYNYYIKLFNRYTYYFVLRDSKLCLTFSWNSQKMTGWKVDTFFIYYGIYKVEYIFFLYISYIYIYTIYWVKKFYIHNLFISLSRNTDIIKCIFNSLNCLQ